MAPSFTVNKYGYAILTAAVAGIASGTFFLFDGTRKVSSIVDMHELTMGVEECVRMAAGGAISLVTNTQTINEWAFEADPDIPTNNGYYIYVPDGTNAPTEVFKNFLARDQDATNVITSVTTNRSWSGGLFPVEPVRWDNAIVAPFGKAYTVIGTNEYVWLGFQGYTGASFVDGNINSAFDFWYRDNRGDHFTNTAGYYIRESSVDLSGTFGNTTIYDSTNGGVGDTVVFTLDDQPARWAQWYTNGPTAVAGVISPTGIRTGKLQTTHRSWTVSVPLALGGLWIIDRLNATSESSTSPYDGTLSDWGLFDAIHANNSFLLGWDQGGLVHGKLWTVPPSSWGNPTIQSYYLDTANAAAGITYSPGATWDSVLNVATQQWVKLGFPATQYHHTNGAVWFDGEAYTNVVSGSVTDAVIIAREYLTSTNTLIQAYAVLNDLEHTLIVDGNLQWDANNASNYYVWSGTGTTWAAAKTAAEGGQTVTTNISDAAPLFGMSGEGAYSNYTAKAYRRNAFMENKAAWRIFDGLTNTVDAYTIGEAFDPWSGTGTNVFHAGGEATVTNWGLAVLGTRAAAADRSLEVTYSGNPWDAMSWPSEPATNSAEGFTKTAIGVQISGKSFVARWEKEFCTTDP